MTAYGQDPVAVDMPVALLREHTLGDTDWPSDRASLSRLAGRLGVGTASLVDRLHNVGMLTRQAADDLMDTRFD